MTVDDDVRVIRALEQLGDGVWGNGYHPRHALRIEDMDPDAINRTLERLLDAGKVQGVLVHGLRESVPWWRIVPFATDGAAARVVVVNEELRRAGYALWHDLLRARGGVPAGFRADARLRVGQTAWEALKHANAPTAAASHPETDWDLYWSATEGTLFGMVAEVDLSIPPGQVRIAHSAARLPLATVDMESPASPEREDGEDSLGGYHDMDLKRLADIQARAHAGTATRGQQLEVCAALRSAWEDVERARATACGLEQHAVAQGVVIADLQAALAEHEDREGVVDGVRWPS